MADLTRPRCFNRPDYLPGAWVRNGFRGLKPVIRWERRRMSTGCANILSIGEGPSLADVMGYDCEGCRHKANPDGRA